MDTDVPQAAAEPAGESTPKSPKPGRGAGVFVALFTLCVLVLLTGYRFAIGTVASDRYLFEVSRHTAWLLDGIGYSAELEKNAVEGLDAGTIRATLYGTSPERASEPLSPWERWRYRALIQKGKGEIGPRITFVFWPGIQQALEERQRELAGVDSGKSSLPPEELATLTQQIAMLQRRMDEIASDPSAQRERLGVLFTFYVVPSCGAIEIMAIFFAAVVAFPAPWRHRAWGLALGLPLMYLVNIFRLACLACLGALDQSGRWFNFVHEYVWQAGYVIFVVLVWMAWVELGRRRAV